MRIADARLRCSRRTFSPLVAALVWGSLGAAAFASPETDAPESPQVLAWAAKAAFPDPQVRGLGVFFPKNGRFYVLGGRTSDSVGSDSLNVREYNPVTNSWAPKAAFADIQVNNMVGGVLTLGGTPVIVAVGGSAAGQTTATSAVRYYNPATDAIGTNLDPWPGNNGGTTLPGGAAVYNNKLYVFGGFNINVAMVTPIWILDPARTPGSQWTLSAAALPTPLGYLPTATSGAHIYTLGGSTYDAGLVHDSTLAFRYDPALDSLTPIAALPRATGETRAVTGRDGRISVLGGGREAPNPSAQVDVYDPLLDSWSAGPAMPTARRNFPADGNPNTGDIWAVGGYAPAAPTNVHENLTEGAIFRDDFESAGPCFWSHSTNLGYSVTRDLHGEIVPGTLDTGNHGDDDSTVIALPFPYVLYDFLFLNAAVGSNGHLTFGTVSNAFNTPCMPIPVATYAIGPYWADQCTGACFITCTGCGIFTSITGVAPSRIFNVEYRTRYFNSGGDGIPLNYVVRLYEGQRRYDVIYETINAFNPPSSGALNVGVQFGPSGPFTLIGCDANQGLNPPVAAEEIYIYQGCGPLAD